MDPYSLSISLERGQQSRGAVRRGSQPTDFNQDEEFSHVVKHQAHEASDPHHARHSQNHDVEREHGDAEDDQPASASSRARRPKSVASNSHNDRLELKDLHLKLLHLESRLNAANPEGLRLPSAIQGAEEIIDLDAAMSESIGGVFDQQEVIPEMVERNWFDFMNKDANQSAEYAVEILIGKPDYYHPTKVRQAAERSANKNAESLKPALPAALDDGKLRRMRINSPQILTVLNGIDNHIDPTGALVMLQPFKMLVFHDDRIRDKVNDLEQQVAEHDLPEDQLEARLTTLKHMRCLLKFMDTFLTPRITKFQDPSITKIAFRDLWYIFRPGEDIYMPLKRLRGTVFRDHMDATPETFLRRYNMLWRVTGTGGGRPNISRSQDHEPNLQPNSFQVNCYYIDFDGKFFLPTTHTFAILPYSGEKDITSLDFFPMRYMKDGQARLKEHTERGRNTFRTVATGFTHFYYSGLSMVTQPCGCQLQNEPLHQEFIDSEVIVDLKTALLRHPAWRPRPTFWKPPPKEESELLEKVPVRYWSDKKKHKLARTEYDFVHDDHHVDKELAKIFKHGEPIFAPVPSGWASNAEMVVEKDFSLLTPRVFAFVLRTRSFAALWLWALSPIESQKESLKNLQLRDDSSKYTIQKLVEAHFKHSKLSPIDYDIIQGKGRGLVILLHGAPGVGKTSTAEAIAAASGKPLFQITTADLGLDPASVEKALKEIFRYAQIWNCVLLLDECDVFLAQRTKNDVLRNALVSVFLRTLEFYTGVLFLTTNRVGVLDEAIKSRLTYTAYYPPLDDRQTRDIWKVNIRLVKERNKNIDVDEDAILQFARAHFWENHADNFTWNGRQIQTAFKVAVALAEWDDCTVDDQSGDTEQRNSTHRPRLTPAHFKIVAQGIRDFDEYLRNVLGADDDEIAFGGMIRADGRYHIPAAQPIADPYIHALSPDDYTTRHRPSLSPSMSHRTSSAGFIPSSQVEIGHAHQSHPTSVQRRRSSAIKQAPQSTPLYAVNGSAPGPGSTQNWQRRPSTYLTASHAQAPYSQSPRMSNSTYPLQHANSREYQDNSDLGTPLEGDWGSDNLDGDSRLSQVQLNDHVQGSVDGAPPSRAERELAGNGW